MEQKAIEQRLADLELRMTQQTMLADIRLSTVKALQMRVDMLQRRLELLTITGTGQNIMLRFQDSTGAVRLEVGVDAQDCPVVKAVGPDGAAVLGVTPGGLPHVAVGRNGRTGFCAMAEADGTANLQLKSYGGMPNGRG